MTIINTIELMETAPVINFTMLALILIAMASFAIAIYIPIDHKKVGVTALAILVFSIIGLIVCGTIRDDFVISNGEYQYEILIDDTVTFSEVNEKYNIIDQRGEIFLVEEKENEYD